MQENWKLLDETVKHCNKCRLAQTRTLTVLGEGDRHSGIMFVGEGPGHEEDIQGRPFVGPAGKLLDKMLASIGLMRYEVYIANIVKCRPPHNRIPEESEAQACLGYLRTQFLWVRPKIIVCLGATAAKYLYDPNIRISKQRGMWKEKKGIWFIPTYHPAALLRDDSKKAESWEDMQSIDAKLTQLQIYPANGYS